MSLSFCLSLFFAEHWLASQPITHTKKEKSKLNKLSPRKQTNHQSNATLTAPRRLMVVELFAPLACRAALEQLGAPFASSAAVRFLFFSLMNQRKERGPLMPPLQTAHSQSTHTLALLWAVLFFRRSQWRQAALNPPKERAHKAS